MLNILRGASRSATRALNNPISLQRAFLSDEIKAEETTKTLSGFAKAFEKFEKPENFSEPQPEENATFLSLLRNSKFVDLGDPVDKVVTGKIFHIVENDLYIDFGWKFHCVCARPQKNAADYVRGAKVKLRVKDLELSSRFLGSAKDLTILEADCHLIGLVATPRNSASQISQ